MAEQELQHVPEDARGERRRAWWLWCARVAAALASVTAAGVEIFRDLTT
jgi:hypothetical protein